MGLKVTHVDILIRKYTSYTSNTESRLGMDFFVSDLSEQSKISAVWGRMNKTRLIFVTHHNCEFRWPRNYLCFTLRLHNLQRSRYKEDIPS